MTTLSPKWQSRFIELAYHTASWSIDTTKVGAIIVSNNNIVIGMGFNGFPRGIEETSERLKPENKLNYVVHAEENAILNANSSVREAILFTTHHPCCDCAKKIIQSGIKSVIFCDPMNNPRWIDKTNIAKELLLEAKIELLRHEIKSEET